MRYSIIGATVEQIKTAGGTNITESVQTGIIFADLNDTGISLLISIGAKVKKISLVQLDDVTPPMPVPSGEKGYTPQALLATLGFTEDWRQIIIPPLYGEGVTMAVLDSGIRKTHQLINGRVIYSKNFTSSPDGDTLRHGTSVASIITAIAPQCSIIDIKVIGDDGFGTDETVVMGIDEVIRLRNNNLDTYLYGINLSLGKPDDGDLYDPIRVACRAAIDRGLWIAASAGNNGPNPFTITSPACERYVIAVGSINYDPENPELSMLVSNFSSRGPTVEGLVKPDIALLGEDVIVADSISDTATTIKSGTSFAAPLASAIGILHYEGAMKDAYRKAGYELPGLPLVWVYSTPIDFLDRWAALVTVKPTGAPYGKDTDYGWGIPFGELAALMITGKSPTAMSGEVLQLMVPIISIGMLGIVMKMMR